MWLGFIPEPRAMSLVYTAAYMMVVITGIVTLIYPPQTLINAVHDVSLFVAAWLWVLGGLFGMFTGQREWWEGERFALSAMFIGIVFYALILIDLHTQSEGSRLTQLGVLSLAALLLVLRFTFIWRYPFKPRG